MSLPLTPEQKLALDAAWDTMLRTSGQLPNGLPMSLSTVLTGSVFSGNSVTFKPGGTSGDGIVATWEEVQAIAEAAEGPWVLFVDGTLTQPEVPAGTVTDFKGYVTIDIAFGSIGQNLRVKDTAILQNIGTVRTGNIVCEAITSHAIELTTIGARLTLREGGTITNALGVSLVPAVLVSVNTVIIASLEAGAIEAAETSVPMVDFSVDGGFYIMATLVNSRGGSTTYSANSIIGDATSSLLYLHDATDRLPSQSNFLGPIVIFPIAHSSFLNWSNGETGARPTFAMVGQMFFDTTLGIPIWYNGSGWVDAAGDAV